MIRYLQDEVSFNNKTHAKVVYICRSVKNWLFKLVFLASSVKDVSYSCELWTRFPSPSRVRSSKQWSVTNLTSVLPSGTTTDMHQWIIKNIY